MSPDPQESDHRPNHLAHEKSPYLQQHARNPVDWYPWGDEAFRRAADEDKPVFLSIGYATCHWCHVMAHESFENAQIADILNNYFVPVKVDRQERPDIDSIYMAACLQMTGKGGWPLTIIMTPDKKPFFAGTYLPRTFRAGMTGLDELLTQAYRLWNDQRDALNDAAENVVARLESGMPRPVQGAADRSLPDAGYQELLLSFDPVNGGFSRSPKFPLPTYILFLLRFWKRTGTGHARSMAESTMRAMSLGGIHDHLGGGFHRYSTDAHWMVPHFEKMLYDQALLLTAYTEAWLATKEPLYRRTAESIIGYVSRDLISPENAFFSGEDADSEGGEGAFYLWTKQEILDALDPDDGRYAASLFGVTDHGNFRSPEAGAGKNILHLPGGDPDERGDPRRISRIRERMLAYRNKRPRPICDRNILTDWNALMIAALAAASRAFQEPLYERMAEQTMDFLLNNLRQPDGGLLHRWCDGEAAVPAFADDYAFMIRALIELYETGFNPSWLEEAEVLEQYLRQHFTAPQKSGFFFTPDGGDSLIVRRMEICDGPLPSGNSMMLENLVLLGHLTGNFRYLEHASGLADAFAGIIRKSPSAYTAYLCGLDHLLGPALDIIIAGKRSDPVAGEMLRMIRGRYLPASTVHVILPEHAQSLGSLAPFILPMIQTTGNPVAYICIGSECLPPMQSAEEVGEFLEKGKNGFKDS
ncbi:MULTISPECIES: thioredoxin domain-containing protein [unclassified Methanoregula]|uniref:thioredoxin domain-containing protein n=1 Tax=unclassified Methanoregula TaxID=2649730 RepID=UPI0009C80EBD|nr:MULTISPECIES: thioredoxin domain-containing protein [unclassified Methanoregula]OPX63483.1 MAG: hypothetical protein A4E33_01640 [Methanoregula sp. PtaB.Bin085]OPY35226.1 MAG: hypothetical protein A4E34_00903 [Methanoregula sp. PtaU1.Bin006]